MTFVKRILSFFYRNSTTGACVLEETCCRTEERTSRNQRIATIEKEGCSFPFW